MYLCVFCMGAPLCVYLCVFCMGAPMQALPSVYRAEIIMLMILCIILFRIISWEKLASCSKTYALFKLFQ